MKHSKKRIVFVAAVAALFAPTAAFADIVFDPSNFAEAILQVTDDIQLVEQFKQQIQGQLAMLQGWNFTQLPAILASMNAWQHVFSQSTYSSPDPGTTINTRYPSDPTSYAGMSDATIQSMRSGWDQEQRSVLIENRTVQNQTYLNLQPTADRVQADVDHSDAAPGVTAAMQAGNEELATLIAQLQTLQTQEITDARGEAEKYARDQAEAAYAEQQRQAVHGADPPPPSISLVDAFPMAD